MMLTAKSTVLAFFAVALYCSSFVSCAVNDVYLRSSLLELGIHPAGSYGSEAAPSSSLGFHNNAGNLGFVADHGRDGWNVAASGTTAYSGDYFVPGTPEEGFSVSYTIPGGAERICANYGLMELQESVPSSHTDVSMGTVHAALWQGSCVVSNASQVSISATTAFSDGNLFFLTTVTITNAGTNALTNVEYMRNVDPDQEQRWTGVYTTRNQVVDQPDAAVGTTKAVVQAEGLMFGQYLALATYSKYATASTEGFSNRDPDDIIDSPVLGPKTLDEAIALAFRYPYLAPGASWTLKFANVLEYASIVPALFEIRNLSILAPGGYISGPGIFYEALIDSVEVPTSIVFYVNGAAVGIVNGGSPTKRYSVTFDASAYADGVVALLVEAHYTGGAKYSVSGTVIVSGTGPNVAFSSPAADSMYAPSATPTVTIRTVAGTAPVRVTFNRVVEGLADVFLGQITSAPFTVSVSLADVPHSTRVIISASAYDAAGRVTTITLVLWTTPAPTMPPSAAPSVAPSVAPTPSPKPATAAPSAKPTATPKPSVSPTTTPTTPPNCNNGMCGDDENCNTCPTDCGVCPMVLYSRAYPSLVLTAVSLTASSGVKVAPIADPAVGPTANQQWRFNVPMAGHITLQSLDYLGIGGGPKFQTSPATSAQTWDFVCVLNDVNVNNGLANKFDFVPIQDTVAGMPVATEFIGFRSKKSTNMYITANYTMNAAGEVWGDQLGSNIWRQHFKQGMYICHNCTKA